MNRTLKLILPIAVLALGLLGAIALIAARPATETRIPETLPPLVRVLEVRQEDVRLSVTSQGTVAPRTESELVPEVAGRILEASPSFVAGGFFEKSEVLLRIDPRDYELAVISARARVAEAELALAREEEEAAVARREWDSLGKGKPAPLVVREPQLAQARAALESARADLSRAELNLERTEVKAPFAGRIRSKRVDIGQYVTPGNPVASIYAVDYAEVRLPIPDDELAFLDLPLGFRGAAAGTEEPQVRLRATFAGQEQAWEGRIVRTEGEIDPKTRMIHAVARVKDPYARKGEAGRPPLAVGMFVHAEIDGRLVREVISIPRAALRNGDQVLVVDPEDRLRIRQVEILRAGREDVILTGGLQAGERICLSPLDTVTDGMRVRAS